MAVSHLIQKQKDSERWGLSQYSNSRLGRTPFFRGPEDNRVCRLDKARKRDLAFFLVLPFNPTPISQPCCEPHQEEKAGGSWNELFIVLVGVD